MLALKTYQQNAIDALDAFLRQARLVGAKSAFEAQVGQGIPYRREPFDEVPCVCLRLPTGGGKTLLASYAIVRMAEAWRDTDAPVALWLTPSDTIRSQTLAALQKAGHPYREALEARYGARLRVCDLEQVATLAPSDLGADAIVIVATIQAFRVEKTALRNVYAFNEAFDAHFKSLPPQRLEGLQKVSEADLEVHPYLSVADVGRVKHSLVNWLALANPVVVVDEAHNNRTELSFRALKSLNPSCILELTATPLAKESNVLYHVSAQELAAEDMIKLPIVLAEYPTGWESAVFDAIQRQKALEIEAQKEPDYIRPIVLFQAQPKDEQVTVDVLKQHLIDDEHIPASQIAVATGSQRGLDDIDLALPSCPIRYIITVEALKEGWDCPFAYVLCSLQSVGSARDVEQLLGRVLRMPGARRRTQAALNRAYAHVVARNFAEAANALADRLIQHMGFEAMEVAAMLAPESGLFDLQPDTALPSTLRLPEFVLELPFDVTLPADAGDNISVVKAGAGFAVKVSGALSDIAAEALLAALPNKKTREQARGRIELHNALVKAQLAPSLRGIAFAPLPQLCWRDQGELELIEREALAGLAEVDLLAQKIELPGFNLVEQTNSFEIYVDHAKVKVERIEGAQLALNAVATMQTEIDLVRWLDQQLRQPFMLQAPFLKYLGLLVRHLTQERGFNLAGLIRSRFQLVQAIEQRVLDAQQAAVAKGFRQLVIEGTGQVEASARFPFRFEPNRYPVRSAFRGRWVFNKHYYAQIAELKGEGEEFDCAVAIDNCARVKHWVRNLVGLPQFAFWLPTSSDYFYPDFVCELDDGRLLVIEYKGEHLVAGELEKRQVGEVWARTSGGKCLFLMAVKKDEAGRDVRAQLDAVISGN